MLELEQASWASEISDLGRRAAGISAGWRDESGFAGAWIAWACSLNTPKSKEQALARSPWLVDCCRVMRHGASFLSVLSTLLAFLQPAMKHKPQSPSHFHGACLEMKSGMMRDVPLCPKEWWKDFRLWSRGAIPHCRVRSRQ